MDHYSCAFGKRGFEAALVYEVTQAFNIRLCLEMILCVDMVRAPAVLNADDSSRPGTDALSKQLAAFE